MGSLLEGTRYGDGKSYRSQITNSTLTFMERRSLSSGRLWIKLHVLIIHVTFVIILFLFF